MTETLFYSYVTSETSFDNIFPIISNKNKMNVWYFSQKQKPVLCEISLEYRIPWMVCVSGYPILSQEYLILEKRKNVKVWFLLYFPCVALYFLISE